MAFDRLWQRIAALTAGLLAFNIAAHVVMPGLNLPAFLRFMQQQSGSMLWLYDRLSGGGLARASIVALGFAPYISVRIWIAIARKLIPRVRQLSESNEGPTTLRRWTRGLTVGASLVQSYGLTQFLLGAPDVVVQPGPGFVIRMMAVLTGGTIVAMLLSESAESLVTELLATKSDSLEKSASLSAAASPELLTSGAAQPIDVPTREQSHSESRQ